MKQPASAIDRRAARSGARPGRGVWPPALAVSLLALLLGLAQAGATSLDPFTERQLVSGAELIFQGTVSAVAYRFSSGGAGSNALPHTFVTFTVQSVLRGRLAPGQRTVVLRFLGGWTAAGNFLGVVGCPTFDRGDRDILFVRRNGRSPCPLVGWEQGRIRVVGNTLTRDGGRELWLDPGGAEPGGAILFGLQRPVATALRHDRGANVWTTRLVGHNPAEESDATPPPKGMRLTPGLLRTLAARLGGTASAAVDPEPFVSADPEVPFDFPALRPFRVPAGQEDPR